MKVIVAFDGRFYKVNGKPCSYHLTYNSFSKRYTEVFDDVTIVGRLYNDEVNGCLPVTGDNVNFVGITGYVGPVQFLKGLFSTLKILWALSSVDGKFILRTPGTIPFILGFFLILRRKKYSVEVVADPHDQLSSKANSSKVRKPFQYLYTKFLKFQCAHAFSSAYVTSSALQKRYPPKNTRTFSYTSLNLDVEWFAKEAKKYTNKAQFKMVTVAMMSQPYKGIDLLLKSIKKLNDEGLSISLEIVGDGELMENYKSQAEELNISSKISFLGRIERGSALISTLDSNDLFILASRQEGLPRAMIEAMSRGLPCIGSNVGGIPELIPNEAVFESENISDICEKVRNVLLSESFYNNLATTCYEKSFNFEKSKVQEQRTMHYEIIRNC
jgi:glycosyltransferase involved in cell wall biosynthesis